MSKHLGELKVGESVAFKGPIPKYPYTANTKKEIGMVAGGEAPHWQDVCKSRAEGVTRTLLVFYRHP